MSNYLANYEEKKRQDLKKFREEMNIIIPEFRAGDTIKVTATLREGETERLHVMEGVCISRTYKPTDPKFIIRKSSTHDVYIEKGFSLNSPLIKEIIILKRGKVRRAKLYYLRNLSGKAARIKERRPVGNKLSKKTSKTLPQVEKVTT